MEKDNYKLPILDILLYKDENRLESDIYYKETDTSISGLLFMSSQTYKMEYSIHTSKERTLATKIREKTTGTTRKISAKTKLHKH